MLRTTRPQLLRGALAMGALLLASCATGPESLPTAQRPFPGPGQHDHRTPKPPADFRLTSRTNQTMSLSWRDASVNEDGFAVERRTAETAPQVSRSGDRRHVYEVVRGRGGRADERTGDVLTFTDTSLKPDTQYCYRVKAYNENGPAWSDEVCGRTTNGGVRVRDHRTR